MITTGTSGRTCEIVGQVSSYVETHPLDRVRRHHKNAREHLRSPQDTGRRCGRHRPFILSLLGLLHNVLIRTLTYEVAPRAPGENHTSPVTATVRRQSPGIAVSRCLMSWPESQRHHGPDPVCWPRREVVISTPHNCR